MLSGGIPKIFRSSGLLVGHRRHMAVNEKKIRFAVVTELHRICASRSAFRWTDTGPSSVGILNQKDGLRGMIELLQPETTQLHIQAVSLPVLRRGAPEDVLAGYLAVKIWL